MLTESQEQINFVQWMRLQYPQHWVHASPNGGVRNIVTAARLKKEGVSAGFPDLFIPSLRLFIEMKRIKGGVVSAEQQEWITYLREHGYRCAVCKGFDEAKDVVRETIGATL